MDKSNVTYTIDDEPNNETDETNLNNILKEFEDLQPEYIDHDNEFNDFDTSYQEDVLFAKMNNYELNFTVKQLTNICDYYKISSKKMKKPELIACIVDFENNPNNTLVVMKRQKFWYYLDTLRSDSFMRKFIVFW